MSERAIEIIPGVTIDPEELEESFIRSGGPGGQNVNKVATAVQLRFDVRNSPSLPPYVRRRAEQLAGSRLTKDGVIVLTANSWRTQSQNREDARKRLVELLQKATQRPKMRRPTKPSRAARTKRMDRKTKRGALKKTRGKSGFDD